MAKTTLSRTVFIGLGGTGADAIVRTKSLMLDNFGEVPPMIKFLAIDTDSITKIKYKNREGDIINLDDDEFIHFRVPDVYQYVNANPKETNFFEKEMIKKKNSIMDGAGQFRSFGRLSLIANDNETFRTQLKNIFDSVKHWKGAHDDKYQVDTHAPTRVFVVFSIAGGTGAGLFVDFSLLLKGDKVLNTGISTIAVALLPDVYASLGVLAANCRPNAISGITEYEFIADDRLAEIHPDPNHHTRNILTTGGKYPAEANNLYDTFFMVNNESSTGVKYESTKEMADIISKSLYLAAGATGGAANSALDNMTALKQNQKLRGKMLRYLGLGCAEMVFDSKQVAAYYSLLHTHHLCSKLLYSEVNEIDVEEVVQGCFDEWKIQEDRDRDDVINYLLENKPKQRFSGVHEFDESAATAIKSKRDAYIPGVRNNINESVFNEQGKLDQLTGRGLNLLQEYASEKINTKGGLDYLKKILPVLNGRFQGMMDEMTEERKDFEQKLSRLENHYNVKLSDINDAASISRFNVFKSRAKAIESACEEYVDTVNTEASYIHEIERRTAAIAFYRKMIERSEDILKRVISFEERLRRVIESASRQTQRIKRQDPKEPFTIHITPEYISSMGFDSSEVDMDGFLSKIKLSELVLHGHMEASELFSKITAYTNSLEKTKTYKNITLLDVLEHMPKDRVRERFLMLKSSIGILRKTDPNFPIDNARNYVIGVYDTAHPAIIDRTKKAEDKENEGDNQKDDMGLSMDGDLAQSKKKQKKLPPNPGDIMRSEFKFAGRFPELSNTKDPNKIIVSAYESAVPAFVVKNFEGYAFDMEHKKESIEEKFRYSNKFWGDMIMQRKYSIFPKSEDDAFKAWTLAFFVTKVEKEKHGNAAMEFVKKPKNGKYAVYTTSGDRAMKELHAHRPKAYEMFKEHQLADSLLPYLRNKIKENLSTYKSKLDEIKNDHQGNIYINEYSTHNLGKTTYNSEAHANTRKLVMDEFRFLQNVTDISDLIS